MKKENLRLREMDNYIKRSELNMVEAHRLVEMQNEIRKNDIPYTYLAISFIKGLGLKGYNICDIPEVFLKRLSEMTFDDASNLVNIMYFKEDLGMKDCYPAIKTFYNFFNDDINYDNDRFNAIREYIVFDNDVFNRLYRTITIIDVNLLAKENDDLFFLLLEEVDPTVVERYFTDNNLKFDEKFNKNMFLTQLSNLKFYINEKQKQRTR